MTWVIATVGVCYIATAYALSAVRALGRVAMVFGGVCSIVLALSPQPVAGTSPRHIVATAVGFTAMAIWPCLAVERGPCAPWALRTAAATAFTVTVVASAAWFLLEAGIHGQVGLAERVVTALQALWPLTVAVCLRRTRPLGALVQGEAARA